MSEQKPDKICQTCGSRWDQFEYKQNCPECGGGALQVPCLVCSGTCGAMWNRAVIDSNDAGAAHWVGVCYHQIEDRYAEPHNLARPKQRYLFSFAYENLEQRRLNALFNDDAQCSARVWVEAASKSEAVELGRAYADLYVMNKFETRLNNLLDQAYVWSGEGYAEWLEEDLQALQAAEKEDIPIVSSPSNLVRLFAQ